MTTAVLRRQFPAPDLSALRRRSWRGPGWPSHRSRQRMEDVMYPNDVGGCDDDGGFDLDGRWV